MSDSPTDTRLSKRIPLLFAAPVSCCIATPDMYYEALFEEEAMTVARAVVKRRREYAAGRAAARRALAAFGFAPAPILSLGDRTPRWPPGIVGSISHCPGCCVAVVARSDMAISVGIDVEDASPLPTEILHMIGSTDELEELSVVDCQNTNAGKLLFCAKEAFYKCYYPMTKTFLEFLDVSVSFSTKFEGQIGSFQVAMTNASRPALPDGCVLAGRWFETQQHIFAGVSCARAVHKVGV